MFQLSNFRDEFIFMTGGRLDNGELSSRSVIYLPHNGKEWKDAPRLYENRYSHSANVISGRLYVYGGFYREFSCVKRVDSIEWLDANRFLENRDGSHAVQYPWNFCMPSASMLPCGLRQNCLLVPQYGLRDYVVILGGVDPDDREDTTGVVYDRKRNRLCISQMLGNLDNHRVFS